MKRVRALGYTDAALAAIAGVNRSQPGRWAKGATRPGRDSLTLICRRILDEHPGRGPMVTLELCAAAGHPDVATELGVQLPLTGPAETEADPYTGMVWQLVQGVRQRAADAGLPPDEQEEIVAQALRTAGEQAELRINTAHLHALRTQIGESTQDKYVAGNGHESQ